MNEPLLSSSRLLIFVMEDLTMEFPVLLCALYLLSLVAAMGLSRGSGRMFAALFLMLIGLSSCTYLALLITTAFSP